LSAKKKKKAKTKKGFEKDALFRVHLMMMMMLRMTLFLWYSGFNFLCGREKKNGTLFFFFFCISLKESAFIVRKTKKKEGEKIHEKRCVLYPKI
tara:strand:- start:733 stop:1014 length:282 start_codon:yes stop_codon:yes gene_type:complete